MIHITQLLFIVPGKEDTFHQFEDIAIPLMAEYGGRLLYRFRPGPEAVIGSMEERPYEVHIITFDSEADLDAFLKDERRQSIMHLKEASIRKSVLIKGAVVG
jgi:uncharacterized protein (DUF1330 family)